MVHQQQLTLQTSGHRHMHDLTGELSEVVRQSGITTGVAQVFEITTQLRGKAEERQRAGAKIGLTHCQGFGGATGVHVFAKE